MVLSEKVREKQKAVDSEPNGPPDFRELTIRFTEGIPDLVLHIVEKDSIRDVKAKMAIERPQLADRRLRLIHAGRLLTDGIRLHPWLTALEKQHRVTSTSEESHPPAQSSMITWLHCSVGPVVGRGTESEETLQVSQIQPLRGFDRLETAGFSEEDNAYFRRQFHGQFSTNYLDLALENDNDHDGHARALEEQCIDSLDSGGNTQLARRSGSVLTSVAAAVTDDTTLSGVNRQLLILYATETGTARETADRISRECRRAYFQCRVSSMDTYLPEALISETLVLFIVATTGSGAEPRMMIPLWNLLLRSHLPHDLFEDLDFSVFGLGDSAYERFCWPAKKLSKRLLSLGAREICPRGEGDDQHQLGLDGALEPWIENLLETLFRSYPLDPDVGNLRPPSKPPPRVITTDMASAPETLEPYGADPNNFDVTVRCNRRITAEDWFQDVRHFEFVSDRHIEYNPGDVAIIHPIATGEEVDSFLLLMGWANLADVPFSILHSMLDQTLPDHIPRVTTLRALFTHHLDFNAVPRRSFFQILRYFTTDDSERERLDEFLSPEGADEFYEYCQLVKRTIREVLSEFRSARIPRDYIFDVFPPLRPRHFSIASSAKCHPREIHLCVAIVKYRTKLKMPRKGVCTSYLANLRPDDQLQIRVEKGFIKLPDDPHIPVICVGPGTGIAPMRAVIEDRIDAGSNATTLYFGCRSKHKDHHYGTEWETYAESKQITYRVAFSRDGPEGTKRTYVQDLILEDKDSVWDLLNDQRGTLIISGSSNKMPAAVRRAISNIAEDCGKMQEEDALKFVNEMEREGRLIEECWS